MSKILVREMNKDETENITIKLSKAVMWRLFCRFFR